MKTPKHLKILEEEKKARASLRRVLQRSELETHELEAELDILDIGNALYSLEKLWVHDTAIKSYQNFLSSILNGYKVAVIVDDPKIELGSLDVLYALSLLPAVADSTPHALRLIQYFQNSGVLGGIFCHITHPDIEKFMRIRKESCVEEEDSPFVQVLLYGKVRIGESSEESE